MATHATQRLADARLATLWTRAQRFIGHVWRGIRDWCGDSAYERYLSATQRRPMQDRLLTREKFYVEQLERRYSRPNRCC
jgi:uncharacterized short protein YbdD (DUF466 family)